MPDLPKSLDDILKAAVEAHYVLASALIVILVILVLYLFFFPKEKYGGGPTSMLRNMTQDQAYVGQTASENRERAEGGKPAAAAQSGPKEGSAAWNVLHSDEFHCDSRDPVSEDAWGWMVGHSKDAESMRGAALDAQFSADLAGQRRPARPVARK